MRGNVRYRYDIYGVYPGFQRFFSSLKALSVSGEAWRSSAFSFDSGFAAHRSRKGKNLLTTSVEQNELPT